MPRGSLYDLLHRSSGRPGPGGALVIDWRRRLRMATHACRGMAFLHAQSPPIIHRDLKTANLLVGASFNVKVVRKTS